MQVRCRQLAVPHVALYPAPASAPSSSSQACCPCCVEPNCCSRVGACPCFCTGYTAAFSLGLCAMWLALPMLICAMTIVDLFEVQSYDGGYNFLMLGMWQWCGYYGSVCQSYGSDDVSSTFDGAAAQFNALRALTLTSAAFTLLAAILASIRLARQQRSKPNSSSLNTSTLLSALLALASAGAAFGLSFPLLNSMTFRLVNANGAATTTWGSSWIFLVIGVGLLVKGVLLHLVAHCCYQRNVVSAAAEEDSEQPGLYAAGYPSASVFAHPQPMHAAPLPAPVVYYPTASALHYPPSHYVQQPPMGHIYQ